MVDGARIDAIVNGNIANDNVPTDLAFSTRSGGSSSPSERLRITSAGKVGIGTDNPTDHLQILHTNGKGLTFKTTANHYAQITGDCNRTGSDSHLLTFEGHWNGTPVAEIALTTGSDTTNKDDGRIIFRTQASAATGLDQRMEIDRYGHILISANSLQTFTSRGGFYNDSGGSAPGVQIEGSSYYDSSLSITRNGTGASGPNFIMAKGKGGTTKVEPDDILAQMSFQGAEGTGDMVEGAKIVAKVEGSTGTSNIPTRLEFWTNSGSNVSTERLRITSAGRLLKSGQAALTSTSLSHSIQVAAAADANAIAIIGRAADDIGELSFYEADKSTKLGELQYRQDHLNLRCRVGDIRFASGGTSETLRIDGSGRIAQGARTPTNHGSPNLLIWGSDPTVHLSSTGSTANTSYTGIKFAVAGGSTGDYSKAGIFVQRQDSYNDLDMIFAFRSTNDAAGVAISNEKLRITSDGQLSIGSGNNNLQGQVTIFEGTDFNSASQGGRDNIYLISDRTSGNGQYGSSIAWSRVQYPDRRAAAIVNVQTSSDEDQVGLAFFTHPGSTATDAIVEKLRITHDGQFEMNGVRNIYQSFLLANNSTYNWDFTVPSEGGYGNSFYLVAGYNHYYTTSYGAHRTVWFSSRGTSVNAMGNGIEQYHSQSGTWTFSKPNNTTVRITKTAGTYGGSGYGFFHLTYNHF